MILLICVKVPTSSFKIDSIQSYWIYAWCIEVQNFCLGTCEHPG
jgi:hypothetical protein